MSPIHPTEVGLVLTGRRGGAAMASPVPAGGLAAAISDEGDERGSARGGGGGGRRGSAPGAKLGRGGNQLLLSAIGREEEAARVATESGLDARERRKGDASALLRLLLERGGYGSRTLSLCQPKLMNASSSLGSHCWRQSKHSEFHPQPSSLVFYSSSSLMLTHEV